MPLHEDASFQTPLVLIPQHDQYRKGHLPQVIPRSVIEGRLRCTPRKVQAEPLAECSSNCRRSSSHARDFVLQLDRAGPRV
jgi:hypothetical protein